MRDNDRRKSRVWTPASQVFSESHRENYRAVNLEHSFRAEATDMASNQANLNNGGMPSGQQEENVNDGSRPMAPSRPAVPFLPGENSRPPSRAEGRDAHVNDLGFGNRRSGMSNDAPLNSRNNPRQNLLPPTGQRLNYFENINQQPGNQRQASFESGSRRLPAESREALNEDARNLNARLEHLRNSRHSEREQQYWENRRDHVEQAFNNEGTQPLPFISRPAEHRPNPQGMPLFLAEQHNGWNLNQDRQVDDFLAQRLGNARLNDANARNIGGFPPHINGQSGYGYSQISSQGGYPREQLYNIIHDCPWEVPQRGTGAPQWPETPIERQNMQTNQNRHHGRPMPPVDLAFQNHPPNGRRIEFGSSTPFMQNPPAGPYGYQQRDHDTAAQPPQVHEQNNLFHHQYYTRPPHQFVHNRQQYHGFQPNRPHIKNLDVPKYRGRRDTRTPYDFLIEIEKYEKGTGCGYQYLLDEIVPIALEDEAATWYRLEAVTGNPIPDWQEFRRRFRLQFQPMDYYDQLSYELNNRTQGPDEPLNTYLYNIIELYQRLEAPWRDIDIIRRVAKGLNPENQMCIRDILRCTTLSELRNAAWEAEMALQRKRSYRPPSTTSVEPATAYKPTHVDTMGSNHTTPTRSSSVPNLSQKNFEQRKVTFNLDRRAIANEVPPPPQPPTPPASNVSRTPPGSPRTNRRDSITCWTCGKSGHYANECQSRSDSPSANSLNRQSPDQKK
ncbi:unnamed protein product [Orchesella dallaii]|uniref:CCHC-type domain-containing protein n=1 Tax=Orchesella dallaii TaxID=48710 RepID=A0ABP1QWD2_9HEXA